MYPCCLLTMPCIARRRIWFRSNNQIHHVVSQQLTRPQDPHSFLPYYQHSHGHSRHCPWEAICLDTLDKLGFQYNTYVLEACHLSNQSCAALCWLWRTSFYRFLSQGKRQTTYPMLSLPDGCIPPIHFAPWELSCVHHDTIHHLFPRLVLRHHIGPSYWWWIRARIWSFYFDRMYIRRRA